MSKHKKRQQQPISGGEKIIECANALLAAITEQGHCVRSQGNFASVDICIFRIGKEEE